MATLICAKCGKQIEEENLVECPHCWEIYHRECWEEISHCLSCKKFNLDYAQIQAEKEAEKERLELNKENGVEEDDEDKAKDEKEENPIKALSQKMSNSNAVESVMMMSKVLLVIGMVAGIAILAVGIFFYGVKGGAIGLVAGALVAALGWVGSVLANGFAELINNSQKNTHYLSKLFSDKEDDEKEIDTQWEK